MQRVCKIGTASFDPQRSMNVNIDQILGWQSSSDRFSQIDRGQSGDEPSQMVLFFVGIYQLNLMQIVVHQSQFLIRSSRFVPRNSTDFTIDLARVTLNVMREINTRQLEVRRFV